MGSRNLLAPGRTDGQRDRPQPRGIARRAAARTSFLSRTPPLEQAIAEQQYSAGKWGSLNSASLPGSGSACEAGCKGKEAFSGERLGALWEGRQGVQYPHHSVRDSGPRTSPYGPGSNSLGEAAAPPTLWLRGRMGGLVSYAETKRICIGLVHILNQRTQQSGYSGIVGSRQQQQAARFRTWGVPLYSS